LQLGTKKLCKRFKQLRAGHWEVTSLKGFVILSGAKDL